MIRIKTLAKAKIVIFTYALQIGWERAGIEKMLSCVGLNLDIALETLRTLFLKYMFISKFNVDKVQSMKLLYTST
jgi:hypothetical protein